MKEGYQYYSLGPLLAALIALPLLVSWSGFHGSSGDDYFRALMTYEWTQKPFLVSKDFGLCSHLWFPLHFWLTGLIFSLTRDLVLAMTAFSFIFAVLGLFLLFLLARALFNTSVGILTLILTGFLPLQVWLSVAMTEMSAYVATLVAFFLLLILWQQQGRPIFLVGGAMCLLGATMFRPEGWFFAAVFAVFLIYRLLSGPGDRQDWVLSLACLAVAFFFIIFWLGYNLVEFGHPFYFGQASISHIQGHMKGEVLPLLAKGLSYPFLMFIISPLLVVMTLGGIILFFREFNGVQWSYLGLILAQTVLMILASLSGIGTSALPQRYMLPNVLLLAPFAAYLLLRWWASRHTKLAVVILLAVYAGLNLSKIFSYPRYYQDSYNLGRLIGEDFRSGRISDAAQICSELAWRRILGQPCEEKREFLLLSSAHAALEVFSGRPRNFLINILQLEEAELLAGQGAGAERPKLSTRDDLPDLERLLHDLNIQKVVLQDRTLMLALPKSFSLERVVGRHGVFSRNGSDGLARYKDSEMLAAAGRNIPLAEGISLVDYKYEGKPFQDTLAIVWRVAAGRTAEAKPVLELEFASLTDGSKKFIQAIPPLFWFMPARAEETLVKEKIPLTLPPNLPAGKYAVTLRMGQAGVGSGEFQAKGGGTTFPPLQLPPVTLISSKRDILQNFVTGREKDWRLVAQAIFSL